MDEITGYDAETPDMLRLGLRGFRTLVAVMHARGMPLQPGLSITLGSELASLQMNPPTDLAALIADWRSVEPPTLVIRPWAAEQCIWPEERYSCPLPFPLFDPPIDGVFCEYRESRSSQDRERGWEFNRTIFVRYASAEYWRFAR